MRAEEFDPQPGFLPDYYDDGNSFIALPDSLLVSRLFVLLQRTLVNYCACINFLSIELVGMHRTAMLYSIPPGLEIRDYRQLLNDVHETHDTIKKKYNELKPDAHHDLVMEEYKAAQTLFISCAENIVQTYSQFESFAVVEENHRIEDNRILASDSNFYAVIGCALLRPLSYACSIIRGAADIMNYGMVQPHRYSSLLDAINMACCTHLVIFCRHFRGQVTRLQSPDGNQTLLTADQVRMSLLARVVRGFDPDQDPGVLKEFEPIIPNDASPPSDSSTSTILANSWMRISGTLSASVPYPCDEPNGEDEYENTILREIQTAEDGSSILLISTSEGYVLDILQSLVFFVDMMPLIVRQVRQLYHFCGIMVFTENWATLAGAGLSMRAAIVNGGTKCLAMVTTVRSIITLIVLLVDCLNSAFIDNKWPPQVPPAHLLDMIRELGVSLDDYIQYILKILENEEYADFSNNLDSRAHIAMLSMFDMRYQTMYDLASALM